MAENRKKTLFSADPYHIYYEVHTPVVLYGNMGGLANMAAGVRLELQDLPTRENDAEPGNDTAKDV